MRAILLFMIQIMIFFCCLLLASKQLWYLHFYFKATMASPAFWLNNKKQETNKIGNPGNWTRLLPQKSETSCTGVFFMRRASR